MNLLQHIGIFRKKVWGLRLLPFYLFTVLFLAVSCYSIDFLCGQSFARNIHFNIYERKLHDLRHKLKNGLNSVQLGNSFRQNFYPDIEFGWSRSRRLIPLRKL